MGTAGLVIAGGPLYTGRQQELAALAARKGLPTIDPDVAADLAVSGGLMSYGAAVPERGRRAGLPDEEVG